MTQPKEHQVSELERAILARAEALAGELRGKAEHRRDDILRSATERLRLTEERETAAAKAEAERAQRREIQATELKLQATIDRVTWDLVQSIQHRLGARMDQLREDRDGYRAWLIDILRESAAQLPDQTLHAEVNGEDLEWLREEWDELVAAAIPGRDIQLSHQPTWGHGGVRLRSADNRAQVDNRFEGRVARLETRIQRTILQTLFPGDSGIHPAG